VNAAPSERAAAEVAWENTRQHSGPFSLEFRLLAADGSQYWVALHLEPVMNASNVVTGYVGTAHDYTDAVTRRSLSEQLVGLLDVSADAVLVFDRSGQLLFCNDGARSLVGVDSNDVQQNNDTVADTFLRAIRDQVPREVLNATDTHPAANRWEGELGFRSPDGIVRTLALTLQVVRDASGVVQHFSAIARDITETKQLQDELTRQATHDALTGLPNRVLFLRKLAEALDRSRTVKSGTAVLCVTASPTNTLRTTLPGAFLLRSLGKWCCKELKFTQAPVLALRCRRQRCLLNNHPPRLHKLCSTTPTRPCIAPSNAAKHAPKFTAPKCVPMLVNV
jgi:PAS domain S-box-containing protein